MKKELKQDLLIGHIELWDWLAETGSQFKRNWPEWLAWIKKYPDIDFDSLCFACIIKGLGTCGLSCPITIFKNNPCTEAESYYVKWRFADKEERKRLAKHIANGGRDAINS